LNKLLTQGHLDRPLGDGRHTALDWTSDVQIDPIKSIALTAY